MRRATMIITPQTPPPKTIRRQRHTPTSARYRAYRPCLRWDAGFTCCYCLVHETDLSIDGVDGTGLTSIEHIEPQSARPELADVYGNCAYACRFCNNIRLTQPVVHASGARLLNPWRDAWGAHFRLVDDYLRPLYDGAAGRDARYTELVYRLNDKRKVSMRRRRREFFRDRQLFFAHDPQLLRRQAQRQRIPADRVRLIELARELQRKRALARRELSQRTAIPRDAPMTCRCASTHAHTLPPEVPVMELPSQL